MKARTLNWALLGGTLLASILILSTGCASQRFEKRLVDDLSDSGLVVLETSRGVTIFLPEVLFEFDSASLSPEGRATVDEVGAILERTAPGHAVAVEGHADSVGVEVYNLDLSIRRADHVVGVLTGAGVDESRITAIGFGEAQPAAPNDQKEGRRKNRRVEIVVLRGGVAAPPPAD